MQYLSTRDSALRVSAQEAIVRGLAPQSGLFVPEAFPKADLEAWKSLSHPALAEKVLDIMEDRPIQYTYPLEMPLKDKINAIATKIYRADGVNYSAAASKTLAELTELGYGDLPVCIAKTQYSFSDNAKLTGAPTGFTMEVREVRLAAGAGFVVVICGSIMTMPGLPKKPAAVNIDVDADGKITGLF